MTRHGVLAVALFIHCKKIKHVPESWIYATGYTLHTVPFFNGKKETRGLQPDLRSYATRCIWYYNTFSQIRNSIFV